MITNEFTFYSPGNLEKVIELVDGNSEFPKVLGGGMSLVPMLNLGLTSPDLLVGLRKVPELHGVDEEGTFVNIGAMTSHYVVSKDPIVRQYAPLLGISASLIGDVQVRNRGTIGGSIAHADPAANYLPVMCVLDAEIVLAGPAGRSAVAAKDFFIDVMTTLLKSNEVIVSVRIPKRSMDMGFGFQKFTRVKGNFPIVCAAAIVETKEGPGKLAIGGVTPVPIVFDVAAFKPGDQSNIVLVNSIRSAMVAPLQDSNGDAEYKREMAIVYGLRALNEARANARMEDL
jgi:carbon-monoxide dehydrogenase medium subunit